MAAPDAEARSRPGGHLLPLAPPVEQPLGGICRIFLEMVDLLRSHPGLFSQLPGQSLIDGLPESSGFQRAGAFETVSVDA